MSEIRIERQSNENPGIFSYVPYVGKIMFHLQQYIKQNKKNYRDVISFA